MAEGAIGVTFKVTRVLQAACMVAIIGITSNFVSEIVAAQASPPSILVGTLSIVCVAVLYCIITFILYLDNVLPFLVATVIDFLFLIALIVVSVVVGKPLSYLNCIAVGKMAQVGSAGSSYTSTLDTLITEIASGDKADSSLKGMINYGALIGTSKSTCLEMKTIWGLSIALCILFSLSATTTIYLWKRARQGAVPVKGEA